MENLQGGTLSLEHRYRVDERERQVGFITRYGGHQLPFERPVWIGVYDRLTDAAADSRVFDRIQKSAHRAHRIDAPSVLRILDYGEIDRGIPFVVSERVPSTTLADHLDEHGPLPPADVIPLVSGVADGLEAIQEAGLAHGNLTGDWIHLEDDDPSAPRISYFHVGLTLDELRRMDGAVLTPEIVRAYPPESFARETPAAADLDKESDPTDAFTPTADVWALGIATYEALVGFHPFFDDDEPSDASEGIARLQQDSARPLADFGIEQQLSDVVSQALARKPDARFDSAGDFAEALERTHGGLSEVDSPEVSESAPDAEPPSPDDLSDDSHEPAPIPNDEASNDEVEPGGPASLLVTLGLVALVASNLGWFMYYMQTKGRPDTSDAEAERLPPSESVRIETEPSGATVFNADQKKLGKTPFDLPPEGLNDARLELVIKKAGFDDHPVVVEREGKNRVFGVELRKSTAGD
jgi:serine/threonine protein kinase